MMVDGSDKDGPAFCRSINHQPSTLNRERSEAMDGEVTRLDLLLIERVEHRPAGRVCRECRHLGAPVRVTEANGARRFRRACDAGPGAGALRSEGGRRQRGHTDPDWPACGAFEGC